jgi:predicted amidohydrolase
VNCVGEDGNGVVYGGGSGIYNFQGEADVLSFEDEGALSGRLDLAAQASYREAFPAWQDADSFRLDS